MKITKNPDIREKISREAIKSVNFYFEWGAIKKIISLIKNKILLRS